jgi:hypothetical protein
VVVAEGAQDVGVLPLGHQGDDLSGSRSHAKNRMTKLAKESGENEWEMSKETRV